MTNDYSVRPEVAAKSLTTVKWFVWDDLESDVPVIRPATAEEVESQEVAGGHIVSDAITKVVQGGRILVDAEGVKTYDSPSKTSGVGILQFEGIQHGSGSSVYFETENDLTSIIEALQAARKAVYGT